MCLLHSSFSILIGSVMVLWDSPMMLLLSLLMRMLTLQVSSLALYPWLLRMMQLRKIQTSLADLVSYLDGADFMVNFCLKYHFYSYTGTVMAILGHMARNCFGQAGVINNLTLGILFHSILLIRFQM